LESEEETLQIAIERWKNIEKESSGMHELQVFLSLCLCVCHLCVRTWSVLTNLSFSIRCRFGSRGKASSSSL